MSFDEDHTSLESDPTVQKHRNEFTEEIDDEDILHSGDDTPFEEDNPFSEMEPDEDQMFEDPAELFDDEESLEEDEDEEGYV